VSVLRHLPRKFVRQNVNCMSVGGKTVTCYTRADSVVRSVHSKVHAAHSFLRWLI